jgi:NADPH:quinone reductase-like Zn-dependent oxidoreductase
MDLAHGHVVCVGVTEEARRSALVTSARAGPGDAVRPPAIEETRMNALSHQVAIVTGASSGIGRAAAKLFAHEGAKVVVAARRRQELEALVDEIAAAGGAAAALAGDVGDEAFARALVELATARFGGLDVAFNNAGAPSSPA